MMFGSNKHSIDVMHLIKEGSVGAEIGVWKGVSSEKFLKRNPKHLHLVDSWSVSAYVNSDEHGTYENYLNRYSELTGGNTPDDFAKYYEKVFVEVSRKFRQPNVTIHRMQSDEWFEIQTAWCESSTEKLDWIYIDGDHSFKGCYRDLCNAVKVVKSGGYILGDDYKWAFQKYGKDGVTQAVDKFQTVYNLKAEQEGTGSQFSIRMP